MAVDADNAVNGIIEAILKPLRFAAKDSFARLGALRGLERLVTGLCGGVLIKNPSSDGCAKLSRVSALFVGFDSLSHEAKKDVIVKALSTLEGAEYAQTENAVIETPCEMAPISVEDARSRLQKLRTPLQYVKGIGPKLAERLEKKGMNTVEDMLYFLPIRYEDRTKIKTVKELAPGQSEMAEVKALALGEVRYGRRRVFEIAAGDASGILKLKWFNFRPQYMKRYKAGQRLMVYGAVSVFGAQKEMIHPDVEIIDEDARSEREPSGRGEGMVPVYSQVENFHQKTIRKLVKGVVEQFSEYAVGCMTAVTLRKHNIVELPVAIRQAHCIGPAQAGFDPSVARRSIVFDDLFLLELALALKRQELKKEEGIRFLSGAPPNNRSGLEAKLRQLLPFKLTGAQERALTEIKKDMSAPHPMNRLVQGDVGCGKTVVSLIASLWAVESGYQAAIMAPTEILAEQHYLTTRRYAAELGIKAVSITGGMKKAEKDKAVDEAGSGKANLVIGTHALFQKEIEFKSLGLAVIDEQHRFGVVQRAALRKKGGKPNLPPDMLIMTATPIPRTLSMTVFGDLDVSIIDELPPGRQVIETRVLRERDRHTAYESVRSAVKSGSQAYIVYPLVEGSEEMSLRDATSMKEHLQKDVFQEFRLGLLHGRMKSDEKEAVMRGFKDRETDILIATTVIEVGVDVPNAALMLIEHAERFGLSQLHQLRGRVGRGSKKSVCLLLAGWTNSEDTYKRLKVMESTNDGFKIAEEDLKIRGPGDFLGTRQAGLPDFRLSEALGDLTLLKKAREEATAFLKQNPRLQEGGGFVKELISARWEGRFELAEIG